MKYFIITFSKGHHEITEEQKLSILRSEASSFDVNGSIIMMNSISEIMDEVKYYETFPNKRPETTPDTFSKYENVIKNRTVSTRAKELMAQGFINQRLSVGRTQQQAEEDLENLKNNPLGKMFN